MKGGNVNEFIDNMSYGDELVFVYCGRKLFLQGWHKDGVHEMMLDQWEPFVEPWQGYLWKHSADSMKKCVDAFLEAPIFDGKRFWDVEAEIEWVDA